jgi:hypothetical protein
MNDFEIEPIEEDDSEKEVFDFKSPENVLIFVLDNGEFGFEIETATVIWCANDQVTGAASYDHDYGGFLDYTIASMIDMPEKEGWYVVENVTGHYIRGDGWTTDDDMEFYYDTVRPATAEEIALG